MQSNHIIAYGMDEQGNYFPLPTSSVPDFSVFASLPKMYSETIQINGAAGGSAEIPLGVANGSSVYVHGFELLASDDALGVEPLNNSGALGVNQSGFFTGLEFSIFDLWVQSLTVGSIAELATATNTMPVIVNEAAPGASPFRWVGGMLSVGKFIQSYSTSDINVSLIGAGSGYLTIRAVYSVVRAA